eukprot:XP_001704866.1 Hypothetical protein GL50803_39691 [Giardia lamblia ATCC 50803]
MDKCTFSCTLAGRAAIIWLSCTRVAVVVASGAIGSHVSSRLPGIF